MARHPNNVEGQYYVNQEECVACQVCIAEAPNHFRFDDTRGTSYVYKQPVTDEEIHVVNEAVEMCPVNAPHVEV